MNTKEIEKLLVKYEEGETTLQEEQQLKEFFYRPEVPEHLQSYRFIFHYFDATKKEKISDPDFELKTDKRLTETPVIRINLKRNRILYISSLAAGVLLVIGLFFTFRNDVFKKKAIKDPSTDPAYTYTEVQHALLIVSFNLNIGLDQFQRFKPIDKAMQNIQKISKFYQYQSIIINPDITTDKSIKSMKP